MSVVLTGPISNDDDANNNDATTTRIMTNGIIGQGGIILPICILNSNEYHLHVHNNMNVMKATAAAMVIYKEDVTIRANGSNSERQLI